MRLKIRDIAFFSALTIGVTIFLMFLGPWVRTENAGLACPDWPKCFGVWLPFEQASYKVFLEWFHRFVALITSIIFLYLFVLILRFSPKKSEKILVISAAILLAIQIVLGGLTVLWQLQPTIVNLHLLTALLFLSCLFVIWWERRYTKSAQKKAAVSSAHKSKILIIWSVLFSLIFIQIVTGGRMSTHGASLACDAFPACYYFTQSTGNIEPVFIPDLSISAYEIHFTHRWGGILNFILLFTLWLLVTRSKKLRFPPLARQNLSLVVTLFALQIILGAINVWWKIPTPVTILHTMVAVSIHLSALSTWLQLKHSR